MQLSLPYPVSLRKDLRSSWPVLATTVAVWPLWGYLWRAYTSPGSDAAAWIVLLGALGTAIWIAGSTPAEEGVEVRLRAVGFTVLALALYAGTYPFAPPLARAGLGLGALGLALRTLPGVAERGGWGLAALVGLAAPATDTLNFFVGGLLRAASTQVAAAFLMGGGHQIRVEEATLWVEGRLFSVDAPCSGVNGLWTGLVVAAAIATWRRLGFGGTLFLLATSVGLCVPANGWRAASLVYLSALVPEGGKVGFFTSETAHAAIGLLVFACTVLALLGVGHLWTRGLEAGRSKGRHLRTCDLRTCDLSTFRPATAALTLAMLAAFLGPLLPAKSAAPPPSRAFPGWPADWGGERLRRLPQTEMDRRWARLSPGPLARFALEDGSEMLLRWVDHPTRALHPPEDCYRGAGARVTPLPPVRASLLGGNSALWRRCRVSQDGRDWEVRSLIRSETGRVYSDPAWWWWKVAGPGATDSGPWWAVTIQMPL